MNQKELVSGGIRGAELLVRCLEAHGVSHIFGIPGAKVDAVFDVLVDHGPKLVLCRHEQNAAFMAGAVGRLTGRPGVCLATSGPGSSNLVTGLATATTEGDPVVAMGGAVTRAELLKQTHQSMDTVNLFRPVTKFSAEIDAPETIPEVVANAFRAAVAPRSGAAFLSLPKDVLTDLTTAPVLLPTGPMRWGAPDAAAVVEAAALLNQAKRPVVLAGMGASEPSAAAALRRLLAKVNLPVVNTFEGAGVVSRELLHCFHGRIGLFRNQPGDLLLEGADVVLTIGFDPVEYDPVSWNGKKALKIIHLDARPADMDHSYRPEVELLGSLPAGLDALAAALSPVYQLASDRLAAELRAELERERNAAWAKNGTPVHPLRLVRELRKFLDDSVTVICDVGSIYIWMARYFECCEPRRLLFSNGQQTLGVALPWAIATSLVRPGEKIVSMSGDGGFLFSAMELETAVRLKCPFVHLVWRDGSFDMVKIQQLMKYGRESGVALGTPDLVKFAESFGATGMRINSPDEIVPVMRRAMEIDGPVLVDVPVDYRDNPALCAEMKHSDIGH
ncbi:MAG: acetolactate synthase AlsS [Candidatus Methylacidiphilales bacterium]